MLARTSTATAESVDSTVTGLNIHAGQQAQRNQQRMVEEARTRKASKVNVLDVQEKALEETDNTLGCLTMLKMIGLRAQETADQQGVDQLKLVQIVTNPTADKARWLRSDSQSKHPSWPRKSSRATNNFAPRTAKNSPKGGSDLTPMHGHAVVRVIATKASPGEAAGRSATTPSGHRNPCALWMVNAHASFNGSCTP